jgi:hypothetical protein
MKNWITFVSFTENRSTVHLFYPDLRDIYNKKYIGNKYHYFLNFCKQPVIAKFFKNEIFELSELEHKDFEYENKVKFIIN